MQLLNTPAQGMDLTARKGNLLMRSSLAGLNAGFCFRILSESRGQAES